MPATHDVVQTVVRGVRRPLDDAELQKTALELNALRAVLGVTLPRAVPQS